MKHLIIFLLIALSGFAALAHDINYDRAVIRCWKINNQKEIINASFYLVKNGDVYLQDGNNHVLRFPMNTLSQDDQKFVENREAKIRQINQHPNPIPKSSKSILNISYSIRALIILKKGFEKQQFFLNEGNKYAVELKAATNQFVQQ